MQDTALFMVTNFQYLATCIAFSKGKPFRKPFYTNWLFTISILVIFAFNCVVVLIDLPPKGFIYWTFLNLLPLENYYKYRYIAIGIVLNTIVTIVVEHYIIAEYVTKAFDKRKEEKK